MDAARFMIETTALGISSARLREVFDATPRTVRRWRTAADRVPYEAEAYVDGRWQVAVAQAQDILDSLETIEDDSGTAPEGITLTIYRSEESARAAGIEEPLRDHTARAALIAFVLEVMGYDVEIKYAPMEGAADERKGNNAH